MIKVTDKILINDDEVQEEFIRASGPGGQNVNKVSTAVQLRFDARNSPGLTEEVKRRLASAAGRRMTNEGVLVITAKRLRTREENRKDALERLLDLIKKAAVRPAPRIKTRATKGSKERRIKEKKERAERKRMRGGLKGRGEQ